MYKNAVKKGPIPGTLVVRLSQGKETIVDNTPIIQELLGKHRLYFNKGYAKACTQDMTFLHILIKGPPPPGMEIEHRNRDKLDNRAANLFFVTHRVNITNAGVRRTNKSGIAGVYRRERREQWVASWQAKDGHKTTASFADSMHGGSEGARKAAVARRALEISKLASYRHVRPKRAVPDEEAAKYLEERLAALKQLA